MARSASRPRLLAALIAGILALAVAGCGGSDGGTATSAGSEVTSATDTPPVTESTAADTPATAPEATDTDTDADTQAKPPEEKSQDGPSPPRGPKSPVAGLPTSEQIDYAIKGVLASGVPALACEQTATQNYVKTTFGSKAGCQQSTIPQSAATSVVVTAIKIKGSKSTAKARPSGGPSNGEIIAVKLVRQAGVWKVDSLRSNAPVGP